jgi:hypothetical protein
MSAPSTSLHPSDLLQAIRPIPCASAEVVVLIDGKAYAGFINRAYAEAAVGLWSGDLDANGLPVPSHERGRPGWPAIRGHAVEIVERGARYR